MIRRRFSGIRVARIAGWTMVATAWLAAAITRIGGAGVATSDPAPLAPLSSQSDRIDQVERVPDLPDGGLVVLRYTPSPSPAEQTVVVRKVVERQVVQQAPPPPVSSNGS